MGARKLRELSAEDVDKWLAEKAPELSTRSLRLIHSVLHRAVRNAQARDRVKRNVVALCEVPTGRQGRPSKALTLAQAESVLNAAEGPRCMPTLCSHCSLGRAPRNFARSHGRMSIWTASRTRNRPYRRP
ncbi:hypothetical protein [Actinoallomurus sp. NPDC050550]|uniref:hypothetical protein n=1 Tax=Actinoallomurus sp. NPDC050550 TaxID=3154937 RepID=UPI0033DF90D1